MRKVALITNKEDNVVTTKEVGFFHQFMEITETNVYSREVKTLVAIVELFDGRVVTYPIDRIIFVN